MMNQRFRPTTLIDRIANDLQTRKLAFPASEDVLLQTYASAGSLPWREYCEAVRIVGAFNGTLVLVDDTNKVVLDQVDFSGDYNSELGNVFVDRAYRQYLKTDTRAQRSETLGLTLYRLPRGSYLQQLHGFFCQHAEYIGECRVKATPLNEAV